ncbi:hypothetical protein [Rhizobium sp. EC-SD404]|uniref:hypothetical protein n=1 Tax=Rhizobium sp. EC-SD404 TaxID=2038389 RepID=UPI00125A4AAD|nr:hypothetical protein [Rhizobium sp. EC-SD404]VVT27075.1 hypothetical protein RHIZ404_220762 [Rhizobium sp. EC-SD404]
MRATAISEATTNEAAGDAAATVADYLAKQESKSFLRFLTCGSVDDGTAGRTAISAPSGARSAKINHPSQPPSRRP